MAASSKTTTIAIAIGRMWDADVEEGVELGEGEGGTLGIFGSSYFKVPAVLRVRTRFRVERCK
jgi:hypothetical protein